MLRAHGIGRAHRIGGQWCRQRLIVKVDLIAGIGDVRRAVGIALLDRCKLIGNINGVGRALSVRDGTQQPFAIICGLLLHGR